MINIKDFDPSLIKINKKTYKNIGIYYIGYITMEYSDHVKINSVNPLYLIIGEVDGYLEIDGCIASTDKNKKLLEKYTNLWNEIKYHIQTINTGKSGEYNSIEYEKDYMKIKFNSDDYLPLNKILKPTEEYGKYYPQVFLDECLYES